MRSRIVRRQARAQAQRSVQAALREAGSPLTLPDRLARLAADWPDHPTVRAALARNPNTPASAVAELLPDTPFAVARNPALPLLPLEDPAFLTRQSPLALGRLLLQENLPTALLEILRYHPDDAIADAATHHVAVAGEAQANETPDLLAAYVTALPTGDAALLADLIRLGAIPGEPWIRARADFRAASRVSRAVRRNTEQRRRRIQDLRGEATRGERTLQRLLAQRSVWNDPASVLLAPDPLDRLGAVLNPRLSRGLLETRAYDSHRLVRAAARARLADSAWKWIA